MSAPDQIPMSSSGIKADIKSSIVRVARILPNLVLRSNTAKGAIKQAQPEDGPYQSGHRCG